MTDLEFAGCFTTKGNKKIDLRVKMENKWIYFEMTKIMEYSGKTDTLRLYNLACSFLIGAKALSGKELELQLEFENLPNQQSIDLVIKEISGFLKKNVFTFTVIHNNFRFSMKEGTLGIVKLRIKSDTISNKLKDKYFDELEHFDIENINITVIDTTYLPDNPSDLIGLTHKIFETEGDFSPISAVVLVCKKHIVDEKDDFPIQSQWEMPVVFNNRSTNYEVIKQLFKFNNQ